MFRYLYSFQMSLALFLLVSAWSTGQSAANTGNFIHEDPTPEFKEIPPHATGPVDIEDRGSFPFRDVVPPKFINVSPPELTGPPETSPEIVGPLDKMGHRIDASLGAMGPGIVGYPHMMGPRNVAPPVMMGPRNVAPPDMMGPRNVAPPDMVGPRNIGPRDQMASPMIGLGGRSQTRPDIGLTPATFQEISPNNLELFGNRPESLASYIGRGSIWDALNAMPRSARPRNIPAPDVESRDGGRRNVGNYDQRHRPADAYDDQLSDNVVLEVLARAVSAASEQPARNPLQRVLDRIRDKRNLDIGQQSGTSDPFANAYHLSQDGSIRSNFGGHSVPRRNFEFNGYNDPYSRYYTNLYGHICTPQPPLFGNYFGGYGAGYPVNGGYSPNGFYR